jgi:hypothetical protein
MIAFQRGFKSGFGRADFKNSIAQIIGLGVKNLECKNSHSFKKEVTKHRYFFLPRAQSLIEIIYHEFTRDF